MEEIVEYTEVIDDEHLINESVSPTISIKTPERTEDESREQSSDDNGKCIYIPYDANKNPEEFLEYLKSQGIQLVESDSQEVCPPIRFVDYFKNLFLF